MIERHQRILEALTVEGQFRIKEAAPAWGVSEETLRKDLILLEEQGDLKRVRGGARRRQQMALQLPLPERSTFNRVEKEAIAREACRLIEPRQTVFLDASSTVLTMAAHFPEIEATVLTNASHVVAGLGDRPKLDVICTGGSYEARSRSFVGVVAEESMSRYLINWLFLGVNGLDVQRGCSEINPGQARLKEKLIPLAEKVCVLADNTKLNTRSAFFFAHVRHIDILITDDRAPELLVDQFRRAGVTVIRAATGSSVK
jgi:DeoR/GlpR family transcriptional regulator of sugar metabolism